MENTQTKTCSKCGRTLPIENFYVNKDGKPYSYCKECVKILNSARRITPPRFGKSPLGIHSETAHAGVEAQGIYGETLYSAGR